jgi:hypothetical protein
MPPSKRIAPIVCMSCGWWGDPDECDEMFMTNNPESDPAGTRYCPECESKDLGTPEQIARRGRELTAEVKRLERRVARRKGRGMDPTIDYVNREAPAELALWAIHAYIELKLLTRDAIPEPDVGITPDDPPHILMMTWDEGPHHLEIEVDTERDSAIGPTVQYHYRHRDDGRSLAFDLLRADALRRVCEIYPAIGLAEDFFEANP